MMHNLGKELAYVLEKIDLNKQPAFMASDVNKAMAVLNKIEPLLKSRDSDCLSMVDELKEIPETAILVRQIEQFDFATALKNVITLKGILEG